MTKVNVPAFRAEPGRSYPLGATWDGAGVNFALFSAHAERVELCLFDQAGRHEIQRIELPEFTHEIWHGYLPEATPGQLYGYRVHGPYDPRHGNRFNPNKLLVDPYAKALKGGFRWSNTHFGYILGSRRGDLSFDRRNNARSMPKCQVVDPAFTWGDHLRPDHPWSDTVIYEANVAGMTKGGPDSPMGRRGTFKALSSPRVIDHLLRLGVTAIELMPIHAFVHERTLVERGLQNYWGYNTLCFFAPHDAYLNHGEDVAAVKTMVKRFHAAGIEVILDVVYNHTCEGNELGPTLSLRGIDNATYYRLLHDDPRYYLDVTGCGNSLNTSHPRVLQMVIDSLRYWGDDVGVDGFRFDLATTLGRDRYGFNPGGSFFHVIRQDPVLSLKKLIAEPWDTGPEGYRLGGYGPGWAEWNDRFRDTVRAFWRGDEHILPELATRLLGSSDQFEHQGRKSWASVNFVTAHDGFTLEDVVSYAHKHNEANLEDNDDGHEHNVSANYGVEGPTHDPAICALRARQKRNMLATLLVSQGTPMLLMGDEIGRTQDGNNNAYCQDNESSWFDWSAVDGNRTLVDFVARLIALRRSRPLLTQANFLHGDDLHNDLKSVAWLKPDSTEMTEENWAEPHARSIALMLAGPEQAPILIAVNAATHPVDFVLPNEQQRWRLILDTVSEHETETRLIEAGTVCPVLERSMMVFEGDSAVG
jgi:isoamylase